MNTVHFFKSYLHLCKTPLMHWASARRRGVQNHLHATRITEADSGWGTVMPCVCGWTMATTTAASKRDEKAEATARVIESQKGKRKSSPETGFLH